MGVLLLTGCHLHPRHAADSSKEQPPVAVVKPTLKVGTSNVRTGTANAATATNTPIVVSPAARGEVRVGEVRAIGAEGKFVLVEVTQRAGTSMLTPGLMLRTRTPEAGTTAGGRQTGSVRISPERRDPFVAADVINGEPHAGDLVFYSPTGQPPPAPIQPDPSPAAAPNP